jgi:hypothetical protein
MHIAAFMAVPVDDFVGEALFFMAALDTARKGKSGCCEVDPEHGIPVVTSKPAGHPGSKVAAVRDELLVTEGVHHPAPQTGGLAA